MGLRIKSSYIVRLVYLLAGVAFLGLISFLAWGGLAAPHHSRLPVPSADGEYFAYFNPAKEDSREDQGGYDLIITSREGGLMARLPLAPGAILWSNAGNLALIEGHGSGATLIVNAMGKFLILARIGLSPGAEPRWSRDGNKLAYRRPGPQGDEIAVYDVLQTQVLTVAVPPTFRLRQPRLLFWSPGSEYLYLMNEEGDEVVLDRLDVADGEVKVLVRGFPKRIAHVSELPRMSPDGTRIHLPRPLNSVIDAESGETLWALPSEASAIWSAWSPDGRQLFYWRHEDPTQICAHDFSNQTDEALVRGVQPNGFFTADGRSYIYRDLPASFHGSFGLGRSAWLSRSWGWRQWDVATQSSHALGRLEVWPWEQTLDGYISAREDHFTRVRYGLYDPASRSLSEFAFPTAREDVSRNANSHRLAFWFATFYALLAFAVFLKRSESSPVRAFFVFTLLGATLLVARATLESAAFLQPPYPFRVASGEIAGLGWWKPQSLTRFMVEEVDPSLVYLWALLPPAFLCLAIVFPDKNRFLAAKKLLWVPLFGTAFIPLIGLLVARHASREMDPMGVPFLWIAGPVILVTTIVGLVQNFLQPANRRAREQVRWAALAIGLAFISGLLLFMLNSIAGHLSTESAETFHPLLNNALLTMMGFLAPLAISHALVADKPYDIRLLIRQIIRLGALTVPAVLVFLLLAGGLSWATGGSLKEPSLTTLVIAAVLTGVALAPSWSPYQGLVDRTLDRAGTMFRERLEDLARGLPHILDRRSLAASLSERIQIEMSATQFILFVLDRQTRRLRPQAGKRPFGVAVEDVEFDPEEALCRYLFEERRPFEVEVSPFSPKLIPIFRSAADRLGKLRAAVILALKRRQELLGMMVLGPKATDDFYNSEELDLLMTVADQAAIAIENLELFEEVARNREQRKELADASEMQTLLFPSVVPGLSTGRIAGRCVPARSVSGDYYDFLRLPGKKVGLAIADVSGRGMAASLLMATLQGLIRSQAPTAENLEDLMRRINRQIFNMSFGTKHCTFFYGVYDDTRRELQFVNAGHNPPILLTPEGPRPLESTGLPLGLFAEATPESRFAILEPGTVLVLYSNGITEARNTRGDLYGVDRLIDVVTRFRDSDVGRIADRILGDVSDYMAGTPIEDDQTLVLLKVNPT
ncbi:MAG: SpoIIE family protein phosphatase [Acidobacteria bacterium]|nr:SpoIIE family protein phosphatase [Acidobacteriota bacterium]